MGTKTKSKKPAKAVPAALAKRASALASAKHARLRAEARSLIALVRRRRAEISDAFYDIGEALAKLKARDMLDALGVRSFAELCESKVGISVTVAEELVRVVSTMTREQALAMGQAKAVAMTAIAAATTEDDAPAALFAHGAIKTPRGRVIDPKKASARELADAAKEIRHAHAPKHHRGRSASDEERAYAARLEKALHALSVTGVRVTAVATKPGKPSDLRIEHLPIEDVRLVAKAIAKAGETPS